jgi:hypothetical protein
VFLEQPVLAGGDLKRDMRASTIAKTSDYAVYRAAKRTMKEFSPTSLLTTWETIGARPMTEWKPVLTPCSKANPMTRVTLTLP